MQGWTATDRKQNFTYKVESSEELFRLKYGFESLEWSKPDIVRE